MRQEVCKLSPLNLMTPGVSVDLEGSFAYDHASQQSVFFEAGSTREQRILLASTTQTFRNNGDPYDSDQD